MTTGSGSDRRRSEKAPPRRAIAKKSGADELRRLEAYFLSKIAVYRGEAAERAAELEERVCRLEEDVATAQLNALVSERQLKARIRELEAKSDFYKKRITN